MKVIHVDFGDRKRKVHPEYLKFELKMLQDARERRIATINSVIAVSVFTLIIICIPLLIKYL